jgi:hypothetical protein
VEYVLFTSTLTECLKISEEKGTLTRFATVKNAGGAMRNSHSFQHERAKLSLEFVALEKNLLRRIH